MTPLKTEKIFIRTTPQLKELLAVLCDKKGMSQSNFIEHLVRMEAKKDKITDKEIQQFKENQIPQPKPGK
jgi:hypothetical protein